MTAPEGLGPELLDRVAAGLVSSDDIVEMTTRLLEVAHELIGFDVAYLTRIDWDQHYQEVVASVRADEVVVDMPVGLRIEWADTLCRRAMAAGEPYVQDAADRFPDSPAGERLGIRGFAAIPVQPVGAERPWGTLCAADGSPGRPGVPERVLELLARLIADSVGREQARQSAVRRAELAEERLRLRLQFVASAEHALRSPLTVIRGWTQTMQARTGMSAEQRATALAQVEQAADRMERQLTDLADESRTSLLDLELEPSDVAVDELVADVVAGFAGGRAIQLTTQPVVVVTDPRGIRLALEQVLDNAVVHTPPRTRIAVDVREDAEGAVITVRDRGPGMPEGVDVFAPFTSSSGRSGLGLDVVRSVVRALGGRATVRTDDGAVVELTFPDLAL